MIPRRVVVVAVVCALVLTPVTHVPTPTNDHVTDFDAGIQSELLEQRQPEPPTVASRANVVLRLKGTADLPGSVAVDVDRSYTREGDRIVEGSMAYENIRQLTRDPRITSVSITGASVEADDSVSSGVRAIGADALHEAGVVGENVTVGVIDSDFRVSHPAIAGHDTTYRSFGGGGDWRHGTAVAGVVADTAPGVDLRLAAVGPSSSPEEYRAAVDWLLAGGADVVVDSGSYYAQPGDGSGTLARIATNASEDAVFVTSAGNHANRYWAGNYTGGDWVNFTDTGSLDDAGNYLNDGEPFAGTVDVSVRWDGWPTTDSDFDVHLYRHVPNGRDVTVAKATDHDGQPFEHLSKTVPRGRYYVAIHAKNVSADHRVELFASHSLANRSAGGTTAPASAAGVVSVGAIHDGTLQPFSAQTNVDLVAPDDVTLSGATIDGGTSFAAPYVAGMAALVTGANPDLNATEVRERLYANATDFGETGVDDASGYGVVSAGGVLTASNTTVAGGVAEETDGATTTRATTQRPADRDG
ncbi:S8 family serine peptidase [Halomarina oriensis]|uniref:S8 family serine peptidase n=1 Tax=Halomarina oriensis TaxID=671145 RepID=A0A6B0GKN0_9EURY|nr:S8 family serine peptidase [Halomarina oriensis]MWG35486.1 S8 family serine peptidase [Halomarina oriensis]